MHSRQRLCHCWKHFLDVPFGIHLRCFVISLWCDVEFFSFLDPGVAEKHVRGVGWLLNHRNATIYKKTAMNEMFAWVHWDDADHTHEIPLSLASCEKLRFSVASEIRQGSADSLFHPREHITSEQPLPCQNKQLARALTLQCTWRGFFFLFWTLEQIPGRRLTFRFWIIPENPCLVTCRDAFREATDRFSPVKDINGDTHAVFPSLDSDDSSNEFRWNASCVQTSVKMACHVPYDMPTIAEISRTAYRIFVRINCSTRVTESSSLLVEI